MRARQTTSIVILVAFSAITVMAMLGNPWLGSVFLAVEVVVLGRHALSLCARCSNVACAFNARSRRAGHEDPPSMDGEPYSDLPITRTTVVPLLAVYPLAVIAAWQFSPIAIIALGVVALALHSVFSRLTCAHCGNDCVGNRNRAYKAWKACQGRGGVPGS